MSPRLVADYEPSSQTLTAPTRLHPPEGHLIAKLCARSSADPVTSGPAGCIPGDVPMGDPAARQRQALPPAPRQPRVSRWRVGRERANERGLHPDSRVFDTFADFDADPSRLPERIHVAEGHRAYRPVRLSGVRVDVGTGRVHDAVAGVDPSECRRSSRRAGPNSRSGKGTRWRRGQLEPSSHPAPLNGSGDEPLRVSKGLVVELEPPSECSINDTQGVYRWAGFAAYRPRRRP